MTEGIKGENCLRPERNPFAPIIQHRCGPLRPFENTGGFFIAGFAPNEA
jgi:hypothetical protein